MSTTATTKQMATLKRLASRTGTSFIYPRNKRDASKEIQRLLQLQVHAATFAELDVAHHSAPPLQRTTRTTVDVTEFEISGYGSTATWR